MNTAMLFFFIGINSLISFANAYGAGAMLKQTNRLGGWPKVVNWASLVMAGSGWTWVTLTIITLIASAFQLLEPALLAAMFNVGFLFLIIPLVGSGFVLWAHSLIRFYKRRDLASGAVAGWNTFAQINNMVRIFQVLPELLESLVKVVTHKDAIKITGPIILSFGSGILITYGIARWAYNRHGDTLEVTADMF